MLEVVNPIAAGAIRLMVFDLDGTLIDSRRDLATAVNAMLRQMGRNALPEAVIAEYVGDGAGMLVRRALGDPEDETLVEDGLERFLACYRTHMLDHTYVYDGVFAALDVLRTMPDGGERQFAVLTNKPVRPAQRICDALGLRKYFFEIYGGNSFATKKPDPEGLQALMREAGARPEQTVMVGDSVVDVLTARNAGTSVIGCRFGLSSHTLETVDSDCLVDAPLEWAMAMGAVVQP
ncbi:MAG TPA: HAD-IA family hydrolase [Acidobacteriaceae bacterium]|nr:HAD-IA family hydrolase [Acidobacteriaceae bacterium]